MRLDSIMPGSGRSAEEGVRYVVHRTARLHEADHPSLLPSSAVTFHGADIYQRYQDIYHPNVLHCTHVCRQR